MLLVSGATTTLRPCILERPDIFGTLVVPRDGNALPEIGKWAADNGAFSGFDGEAFMAMLHRHWYARERCLFVTVPDAVGDAAETARLFDEWEPRVRALGYPVAMVAQNGATAATLPWPRMGAVFIGGVLECVPCRYTYRGPAPRKGERIPCPLCRHRTLTEWKLGAAAAAICVMGASLGKWVHMGRVSTKGRIRHAAAFGCDSIDSSGFSKWPRQMLARHGGLLRNLAAQRRLVLDELESEEGGSR